MRSSSSRSTLPGGRGWRGRAHPRPKIIPSTGPGHAWIREEMERIYATPANQNTKNYENVKLKMRKITKKTNLKLRKLCKTTN